MTLRILLFDFWFLNFEFFPMYQSLIDDRKDVFENAIAHFSEEMAKLRTGRAVPALVDSLLVDYYNTKSPIKQIASVSAPEARLIVISPWDKGSMTMIEAAIREANIGLNPSNDGQVIRLNIPPLTEDRRREMVKALNRLAEEARIAVRTVREDIWKEIQENEKEGLMSEDDKFRGKDVLQEVVESFNDRIEELREKKEKEIMTV